MSTHENEDRGMLERRQDRRRIHSLCTRGQETGFRENLYDPIPYEMRYPYIYIYISACLTRDPTLIEVPLTAFPADPPVSTWEHFLPRIVSLVADDGILWDGIRVGGMDRETGVFQILTDRERLLMVTGWRVSFCVF